MGIFFEDDEVIHCDACGDLINLGDYYQVYKFNGKEYRICFYEDCKEKLLYKLYCDDFEERKRYSKADYLEIWEGLK